ncbi:hypothetical protein J1614_012149 [Plenodomus biglobosus]|nr:hypothetical protein J1614_012149 [Plenodomus biglobosus]
MSSIRSASSRTRRRAIDEVLGQDGEEETTSLSGTSLSTGHKITATHDDGNGVLLDRGGDLVARQLDVAQQMVIQRGVCEAGNRLGDTLAGSLNGDVIVLLEVDARLLLGGVVGDAEEITLETLVGWAGNVLAVLPLAVTRATRRASASRATAWLSVCASVESALRGTAPSSTALGTVTTTGSEVGCVGPAASAAAVHLLGGSVAVVLLAHLHMIPYDDMATHPPGVGPQAPPPIPGPPPFIMGGGPSMGAGPPPGRPRRWGGM